MNDQQELPSHKKLTVVYKMEPGCLGPNGVETIEGYCQFAQKEIASFNGQFVKWLIQPRFDKSLAEIEYQIDGKRLSSQMAAKYLSVFECDLDDFEEQYNNKLMDYIEIFLER